MNVRPVSQWIFCTYSYDTYNTILLGTFSKHFALMKKNSLWHFNGCLYRKKWQQQQQQRCRREYTHCQRTFIMRFLNRNRNDYIKCSLPLYTLFRYCAHTHSLALCLAYTHRIKHTQRLGPYPLSYTRITAKALQLTSQPAKKFEHSNAE